MSQRKISLFFASFLVLMVTLGFATRAQADFLRNQGCTGLTSNGGIYTQSCAASVTNIGSKGEIVVSHLDDTVGFNLYYPTDVNRIVVTTAGPTDYFSGPGFGFWGSGSAQLSGVGPGQYFTVSMRMTADYGVSGGEMTFTFYRVPGTVLASCSASPNPIQLQNGKATTTLTGSASDPWSGVITRQDWDFGDGTTATTAYDDEGVPVVAGHQQLSDTRKDPLTTRFGSWLAPVAQAGGGFGGGGPPISLSASPTTVTLGQSSTISWSISGEYADSFTLVASNEHGTVSQTLNVAVATGPSDRQLVEAPPATKTSSKKLSRLFQPETAQAGGGGGEASGPLTIQSFHYTYQGVVNGLVPNGATVKLNWSVSGVPTIVTINGRTPPSGSIGTGSMDFKVAKVTVTSNFVSGNMASSGSSVVTPASYVNQYTVTATDPSGTSTKSISIAVLHPPVAHTYRAPGTYTVTLKATSSFGNYGVGQCSVTVLPPPSPSVDLTVQGPTGSPTNGPLTVPYQSRVTLTWTSANSTSCLAGGAWSGTKATSGSEQTSLLVNGTYTYTVTCSFGSLTSTDSVVVLVESPPAAQVDLKASKPGGFASDSLTVDFNNPALLSWTTATALSCLAGGAWSGPKPLQNASGESTGNLTSPKTYTLTCLNPINLPTTDTITIQVGPRPDDFPQSLFEGAFIGPSFTITRDGELKIHFDSRIQQNPPPGFVNLLPPATEEGS